MSLDLETFLTFAEPLTAFMADPTVTDILVNEGGARVFIERLGLLEPTRVSLEARKFRQLIPQIARACDDETDEDQPLLNARLADGSRVSVIRPPVSVDGDVMSIRKFGERYSLAQLVAHGALTPAVVALLTQAVGDRQNLLISGGTGTGKTTLLNAVSETIDDRHRIVLIEDNAEILIRKPNLVRVESKRQQATAQPVTITDLVRQALRFRPDRIILGEVRGGEAWDLLHALNTGHSGSFSTIHGNTAEEALMAFGDYVVMSQVPLPYQNIMRAIGRAIQMVAHLERDRQTGRRHVTEVVAVTGYDVTAERFLTRRLYPNELPEAA
jgi:pilus assembly protein CpaF